MTAPGSEWSRWVLRALILACAASFVSSAELYRRHVRFQHQTYGRAQAELVELTRKAASDISAILRGTMEAADGVAARISSGELGPQTALQEMRRLLAKDPRFYGATVTYRPYALGPGTRLHSEYYSKSGPEGRLEYLRLDKLYNYTVSCATHAWYTEAVAKGSRWVEPYWDDAGRTYMTTYSSVFLLKDGKTGEKTPGGVVTIDISMDEVRRLIEGLDLGPSGFSALTTRQGTYLYHPTEEYVRRQMTLRDVAREKQDPDRLAMAEAVAEGGSGIVEHISRTTGERSWLIYEPVTGSDWSLQTTFIKRDLAVDVRALRRQLIRLSLSLLAFALCSLALLLRVQDGTPRRLWAFSVISSLALAFGISYVWSVALGYGQMTNAGLQVSDKTILRRQVQVHEGECRSKDVAVPVYVPTGLQIESLSFDAANKISVTGSVWQRYPAKTPADLPWGVRIANAQTVGMQELGRRRQAGQTVVRWHFEAALRERLDFSHYPLDQETLDIRLAPADIEGRVALIPDLESYRLLSPTLLPGLDKEAVVSGWKPLRTFFEFRPGDNATSYGLEQSIQRVDFPDLHYIVMMRRDFIDAFLSHLTPVILLGIMLFTVLLLAGEIDCGRALSICVAMLFVVVISHVGIRNKISVEKLFYLEFYYFVTYAAILWVSFNAIRKQLDMDLPVFQYEHNLLSRVTFWPVTLGLLYLITVGAFY